MSNEIGFIEPPPELLTPPGDPIAQLLGSLASAPTEEVDEAKEKRKQEDKVRLLFKRIAKAKKFKEKWEQDYEVDRSHDYVRGFQRPEGDELDAQGERKYQINKILAALKTRLPSIFYYFPYVRVRPARGRGDSVGSTISERCELLQDTINTIVRQPKTRFKPEIMLALKEAHWAFGVVEVGYEADWVENPFKQKPKLVENEDVKDDLEEMGELPAVEEDDVISQELSKVDEVPKAETFYVKHIPARQFYVASNDKSATESQDWLGYWEWMYVEDVKRCESFDNTEDLKASAKQADGGFDRDLAPVGQTDKTQDVPADMVRVWKIWDQREKIRYVIAEGHDMILKQTSYYYLPISTMRFEVMPGEWYPIPPIFGQLTEQDEFNDSREWLRIVRKGTRPRFTYDKSAFPADELEKLENDEFFTMIAVDNNNMQAITPVQMPQVSDAVIRTLALSDAGFAEQAASSPVDRLTRGAGGKPTATEVQAMGQSGDVRDSYEQQEFAEFLGTVCGNLIKCALEKMTLPQWVIVNSDPTGPNFGLESENIMKMADQYKKLMTANSMAVEGQFPPHEPLTVPGVPPGVAPQNPGGQGMPDQQPQAPPGLPQPPQPSFNPSVQQYQEVTPQQLKEADDGMQWEIVVDVESLSPVTEEQYGNKLLQALNMLAASPIGMLLSMAPPLLKNVLNYMGIRQANDQQNIFMALQAKAQAEAQAAAMGAPPAPGVAPMPGGGNPNKQGSAPQQPAPQGGAPADAGSGGPQPNAQG
jgi:hypothetical protein